jgi:hypothetical protein
MNNPKLKYVKQNVFIVDSNDFDVFVNEIYGGNYEFVADHEANNYSSYQFDVPNMAMLYGDDAKEIRSGKYRPNNTHKLFKVLHEDGFIESGKYIIKVYW